MMAGQLRSSGAVAWLGVISAAAVMGAAAACTGPAPAHQVSPGEPTSQVSPAGPAYQVGPVRDVSACGGQNAEVEQAVDARLGYVYEEWMGCRGIAFSRSADGGRTWQPPVSLPGTVGSHLDTWDPAVAVAPDGTVYAAFMLSRGDQAYPVVEASSDHGATFPRSSSLIPPDPQNWGDRDFIAVGPDGTVYVTWDYGPDSNSVTQICPHNGSCAFSAGDLNVVMQKSADGGRTWSSMSHISPGFPASGGDSAPLVVEPDGRIDVLYQGYKVTNPVTYALGPAHSYFASSANGGATWSPPVAVGPQAGTMSLDQWWINGDIGIDAAGNLYATWDTQGTNPDGSANDIGWLSFSTDHGARWSAPVQAPADRRGVPHIMEVAGAGRGTAYVSWLSASNPAGYALFLRAFSVTRGWLSGPEQISARYGDTGVWPGDTTGLSALSPARVIASWGSNYPDISGDRAEIYAATVAATLP